jgi:hypothetical protein
MTSGAKQQGETDRSRNARARRFVPIDGTLWADTVAADADHRGHGIEVETASDGTVPVHRVRCLVCDVVIGSPYTVEDR